MAVIAALVVSIGADIAKFEKGFTKAGQIAQREGKATEQRMNRMKTSAVKYTAILATAMAGVGAFAMRNAEAADEIGKMSARLGASTEALSTYRFVAERAGVNFQTLTMAWQRMGRRISEANQNTGEAKDALRELGLTAEKLNALPLDKQFETIAIALDGLGNSGDKVRLAMKLFDSEGIAPVLQALENGVEGMFEAKEMALRTGVVLGEEFVNQAARTVDAMTDLKASFQGIANEMTRSVTPALASVVGFLADALPSAILAAKAGFAEGIASIAVALGVIMDAIAIAAQFTMVRLPTAFFAARDSITEFATEWADLSQDYKKQANDRMVKPTEAVANAAADAAKVYDLVFDPTLQATTRRSLELAAAQAKLTEEQDKIIDQAKDLHRELFPLVALFESYWKNVQFLSENYDVLIAAGMDVDAMFQRLTADFKKATTATVEVAEAMDPMVEAFKRAAREIDGLFVDLFESIFDGFEGFVAKVISTFKRLLAELAAAAFRNTITIPIVTALFPGSAVAGAGGGAGGAAGAGANLLGSLGGTGSIFGIPILPPEFLGLAGDGMGPPIGGGGLGEFFQSGALGPAAVAALIGYFAGQALFGSNEAGIGSAIGAGLGMFIAGPIGAIIGGLLGGAAGSLFAGDDDIPRIRISGTGTRDTAPNFFRDGPFGNIQADMARTLQNGDINELLDALLAFDQALAAFMTPEQIAETAARLRDFSDTFEGSFTFEDILFSRFQQILQSFPAAIQAIVRAVGGSDVQLGVEALQRAVALFALLQFNIRDALAELENDALTGMDALRFQGDALRDMAENFVPSLEALDQLTNATAAFYLTALQLINDIRAAAEQVNTVIGAMITSLEFMLVGDDPAAQFNFVRDQINDLFAELQAGPTDPARIAEIVQEITRLVGQAIGIAQGDPNMTPDALAGLVNGFILFLESVRDIANGLLADMEAGVIQDVTDAQTDIAAILQDVAADLITAGENINEGGGNVASGGTSIANSANIFDKAASRLQNITITVNLSGSQMNPGGA